MRASYTVFYVRAPIHSSVAKDLKYIQQPTQATLDQELSSIEKLLLDKVGQQTHRRLRQKELLGLMGVLMQFTAVLPELRPYCHTDYKDIDLLYSKILKSGRKHPLGFAQQLSIALDQTRGDLVEAVWLLFITSRLYARWYDTEAIVGLPQLSDEQAIKKMLTWSRSLRAVKPYQKDAYQDIAGDSYYCWTHVMAKIAFSYLARKRGPLCRLEGFALVHGTTLNHKLAHKVRPQSTPNDHTIAALYGNTIGDLCVQILQQRNESK